MEIFTVGRAASCPSGHPHNNRLTSTPTEPGHGVAGKGCAAPPVGRAANDIRIGHAVHRSARSCARPVRWPSVQRSAGWSRRCSPRPVKSVIAVARWPAVTAPSLPVNALASAAGMAVKGNPY